jgi:phosphoglycolate phosphatase-like HAD superfamily hydrolase
VFRSLIQGRVWFRRHRHRLVTLSMHDGFWNLSRCIHIARWPTTTAQEVSRFRQHFIQLLGAASSLSPFAPVAGADGLLSRLTSGGEHRVSFATGGWRDSARLKMASAGMCFDDHPAASADDALDRESIIRLSWQRAAERYGESFACTVYVGDGVWDARACRSVGVPFIGIGTGSRATRLSAEGAVCVFPDFSDADIFLRSVCEIAHAD